MSSICIHNATVVAGYAQMPESAVLIEEETIVDVFSERRFLQKHFSAEDTIIDAEGGYLVPGLIDSHIHGFAGYGTEDLSTDSILKMSEKLAAFGVTAFCPTLYPMSEENMVKGIRSIVAAMGLEKGATILGVHLEGPFISSARLGVQRPEFVRAVDLDLMHRLYSASEGHIINMTVAPELKGMRELALYCNKVGIVLQAGHTDASYENMLEGMQAGIRHSTHFFNAMSRLDHRNPNAVGAILIQPDLCCEIIADGRHVHPDLIRLLVRDKPDTNIVLVTDALKPTEQPEGPFVANNEEVYLSDKLFHRKSDDIIAGSSLTMLEGLKNLVHFGIPLEVAVKMASSNPARILKLPKRGEISPGFYADLAILSPDFSVIMNMVKGKFVFAA
ncbi:MAG TPA: N-acetylglucosamine-6-phosphate deacetylase [Rectinemataceae bacterium]|nr:N-acetylglucosamine-6-phosphate deacetylase [Rectinemataceae bacterium]